MHDEPSLVLTTRRDGALSPIATADELAAAFLAGYGDETRRAYRTDLGHWARYLARHELDALAAHRVHVDAFAREAENAGIAPATLARRLAALSGFYAYAVDEGLIARSPMDRVRRPTVADESPRTGLDRHELARLLTEAATSSPRDHALTCLLVLNGLRISETLAADVDDLGLERGHRTLRLIRKRGKKAATVLAPRTAAAIDHLIAGRATGPLFITSTGRRLDRHAAAKTIRRLARDAGLTQRVSPHTLRHAFVTAALDAGVPLRDVQDAAGHADPRTTRRYDRARHSLDRHATYAVASSIAS